MPGALLRSSEGADVSCGRRGWVVQVPELLGSGAMAYRTRQAVRARVSSLAHAAEASRQRGIGHTNLVRPPRRYGSVRLI